MGGCNRWRGRLFSDPSLGARRLEIAACSKGPYEPALTASEAMSCKVDRIRDRYDLLNLDERLARRYDLGDEVGVRDLEGYINTYVLRRAMSEAGMVSLDGEVENYHRLLTDDEVSEFDREETVRELEDEGIDVESVLDDFVTYQTVRKHLNQCLDIDTSRPDYEPSFADARQHLGKLSARVETVVDGTLSRLRDHDALEIGDPETTVQIRVRCGDCGRLYDARQLLRHQRCSCKESEETS